MVFLEQKKLLSDWLVEASHPALYVLIKENMQFCFLFHRGGCELHLPNFIEVGAREFFEL